MRGITLLISSVLFLAFSCDKEGEPRVFEVAEIGKGNLTGIETEWTPGKNMIITNQQDWAALINVMNAVNDVSSTFTETNIDFKRFQVIAVFEEIRYRDGHSIDITEVVEAESSIEVKVENLEKGNSTPSVIQPFHIIKIPKSSRSVVFISSGDFVTIGKEDLCCNGVQNISKQNIVITNQADWTDLMNAMNTVNDESGRFTETDIDFNQFQIIAAFDEIRLYKGATIDITEVTEVENSIQVRVENIYPMGYGAMIAQPFHIVKIPKSDKPVVFI
ncbi:MAG: protease complex subunit PrcB family protein [Cyclobacteriaceae bacterium]|nr:protease complex subunit PrcB family protein [Cyclobacteriaceae bacterium]